MGHGGIDRRNAARHRVRTMLWIAGLRGDVVVTVTDAAPELRRAVIGHIFRTEVHARGLGD